MLTTGIILCYLLGLSLLWLISRKFTVTEMVGYSFLLGIGAESVFLFLLDIVGVKYSAGVLIGVNIVAIAALLAANYKNLLQLKSDFPAPDFSLSKVNYVALFLVALMVYLFYAITVKNLFWIPTEHDSISSFDKLGRIMALEGKLRISLFDYNLEGAGGIYPPLYHSSFAYVYIFGAESPKIVTTLFFLSLLTTFYSLVKNYVGSTAAALFTFILMVTPEMFSHAALSLGNLPTTAYAGAAYLLLFTWIEKRDEKSFWLSAALMGLVIWIRSDTIVFIAAALLLIGLDFLATKDWKKTIIYGAFAVAPFIIWNLYMKLKLHAIQSNKFDLGMGYNSERFDLVWGYVKAFLFGGQKGNVDGGQLYGLVFILFFAALLINLGMIYKNGWKETLKDKWSVLVFFFVSFALYFLVFYLIDVKVQRAPISSLMESSFKRGLFFFIPVVLFYAATNRSSAWLFEKIERFRTGV